MPLLRLEDISLAYGHSPLLARVDFQIDAGERVCLVGRNGAGKTTLLRVVTGAVAPDEGEIWRMDMLRIAHLEQEGPPDIDQTIFEVVACGLGELGTLLTEYHQMTHRANVPDRETLTGLGQLQARIETLGGWNINQKVETVLTRLSLPGDKRLSDCSGGIRRQVMLARALVCEPDLLLLDEPTNHLDINAITWLESYLLTYQGALIFITHDRTFVRRLATRIVELDRGKLTSFPGNLDAYLRKKDELFEIEERAFAKFDKKLAGEEAWIRQGIKARRTRNEGRVRALQALRRDKAQRLEAQGKARFGIDAGNASGKLVVDVRRVSFRYAEHWIIHDCSTRILRGERVGILGPNGSGKSTLLKLILGELQPTSGEVVLGTRLHVAYFDQHRRMLDPEKTVRENMSDSDYVTVKGRARHVIGYLKDFLFAPERIDSPVKALSGGERNRLLLAKIFTRSANMIVLDEPTNDLDVDTLELLEDLLTDYDGTLLLVSHDRTFLDNVVTSTLVFEGNGKFGEYAGGYEDWERYQRSIPAPSVEPQRSARETPRAAAVKGVNGKPRKLTFKEQRERETLPGRIEALEAEQSELHKLMGEADFYRRPGDRIATTMERLETVKRELEACYQRWQILESVAAATKN
ncbi:MAG TPA: ATP-binding cassette domain-containing protein [Candidatus Binatia bacterium]|jgi:ATP-binding cassette subfamily F protein uup|nr:ATP-binding cassette domain-containing protein [Candidatus Binatia bacterium]